MYFMNLVNPSIDIYKLFCAMKCPYFDSNVFVTTLLLEDSRVVI